MSYNRHYNKRREYKRKEFGTDKRYPCPDTINLEVTLEDGDTIERMIKRFLKKFKKYKLMEEFREKDYYEKPSVKRREKKKRGIQKQRKLDRERKAKEE